MAKVTIETEDMEKPPYKLLAKAVGKTHLEVYALMCKVWGYCTEKQIYRLHPAVIDELVGIPEFHTHIQGQGVDLGKSSNDLIYIAGTRGRIEWLGKLRENAKKGGNSTRAKWLAKTGPVGLPKASRLAVPDEGPITTTITTTNTITRKKEEEERRPIPLSGGKLFELWQKHSGPLPKFLPDALSPHERSKIRERLEEKPDLTYWEGLIKKMATTPFFTGENKFRWRADFLWLIEAGNHVKVSMRDYGGPEADEAFWQKVKGA